MAKTARCVIAPARPKKNSTTKIGTSKRSIMPATSTTIPQQALVAAQRYGPLIDHIAAGYHDPYTGRPLSGTALLLKLSKGENDFQMGGAPSSAGARGATQFTPGTRQTVIAKFGIDPWRSYDEAFHAAALHLQGKVTGNGGLAGYNPGDPAYTDYILRQQIGGGHGGAGDPTSAGPVPGAMGGSQTLDAGGGAPAQDASAVTPADVLAALRPTQPAVQASPIQAPFSATQTYLQMPVGYRPLAPSSPPPAPNIDAALALASQVMGPDVGQSGLSATVSTGALGTTSLNGTGPAGGRLGQITVASGANLPGHPLTPAITTFARMVAGQFGQPLTIGTGTNHSKDTINGTVSDHYSGNAVDIPATGQRLHQIGLAALLAAGVPEARARAEAARGGGFDVPWQGGRLQVIFATDAPGWGDHTTHAHLGFSPGR